jgi:hypothetical protein
MNEEGRQMAKTKMASETIESKNKALVLEAFDTLFNKRDYETAQRFWSPGYISTALISNLAAKVCSISSKASRQRSSTSPQQ